MYLHDNGFFGDVLNVLWDNHRQSMDELIEMQFMKYFADFMEQSFEKLICHMASPASLRILWNCNTHSRLHKSPSLDRIVSQSDSFHASISYFFKIHSNSITPSTTRYHKRLFSFRFSDKIVGSSHFFHAF